MRIARTRIAKAMAIQMMAQRNAGMPVAFAMFTASVGTLVSNGEERKKTVFRSNSAFRTHWTARKHTEKAANLALANLASATRPTDRDVPAIKVKGMPESAPHEKIGVRIP